MALQQSNLLFFALRVQSKILGNHIREAPAFLQAGKGMLQEGKIKVKPQTTGLYKTPWLGLG